MAEGGQFWIAAGGQFSSAENNYILHEREALVALSIFKSFEV